jgi:spore coat protein A, manganese oxidase
LPWRQKPERHSHAASSLDEGCISGLARFVDPLPIPHIAKPAARYKWATYYEIRMTEFMQRLHRDMPPTKVWGYDGTYPGPTFETVRDERVAVNWMNNLPLQHLFAIDPTIHGAEANTPAVGVSWVFGEK